MRAQTDAAPATLFGLFPLIAMAFLALELLSWPILFSFDLWVLYDRGSLLNLDYLWSDGLRPGVDTYYSYGLLPVALQHLAFVFGRGYWPIIACNAVAMAAIAFTLSALLRRLPRSPAWIAAILCVTPMMLWVNPNLPYTLVPLAMLGALALVMEGRLDLGLAVCAIGCWCVPSLPLALAAIIVGLIVAVWWTRGDRSGGMLVRALAPGAICYLAIGAILALMFGWRSVVATALPLRGAAFYAAKGYGLASLVDFLSPAGAGIRWYLFTRSGWWMVSTLMLFALGLASAIRMLRERAVDGLNGVVLALAMSHAFYIFVAPGSSSQHVIYDPLLAAGVLVGLGALSRGQTRGALLALFAGLAFLGNAAQVRETWRDWRDQRISPATTGLYAAPDFASEWASIIQTSATHSLLLLSYGTGVHHYFPTVHSPEVWFFEVGLLLPADGDRVFGQMRAADVIVTDRISQYVRNDARMRNYLAAMCHVRSGTFFDVWQRRDKLENGVDCMAPPAAG